MVKHSSKYILAALMFLLVPLTMIYSADAEDVPSYSTKEIDDVFARGKNLTTLNRATALLSDLLRVQKSLFISKHKTGLNSLARKVEGTMNDASLMASQREYDKGLELLYDAYKLIVGSLEEMSGD